MSTSTMPNVTQILRHRWADRGEGDEVDHIIATIGLGFLMAGGSIGQKLINGSPNLYYPWHVKLSYAGTVISILSVISGFFIFGPWWAASILVAWLPLNYSITKIFSKPMLGAAGLMISVILGTLLFGIGLTIAE